MIDLPELELATADRCKLSKLEGCPRVLLRLNKDRTAKCRSNIDGAVDYLLCTLIFLEANNSKA